MSPMAMRLAALASSMSTPLTTFESGVKLIRECSELLDDAEQRITELTTVPAETEANG